VLFKLSISDKGIECFGAKKFEDPSNPFTKDSKLKFHANGDEKAVRSQFDPFVPLPHTVAEITNWSRYDGKGFNIEWKSQGEMPGFHITIFGFEKGDNVCLLYEYATLGNYKTFAKDFEKIRKTFQLK
jgi:hypothetical protein